MLFEDFREPLLSFLWLDFINSFCYRIETNWSFKHEVLDLISPSENFFSSPLRLLKFSKNLNFLWLFNLPFSKPF